MAFVKSLSQVWRYQYCFGLKRLCIFRNGFFVNTFYVAMNTNKYQVAAHRPRHYIIELLTHTAFINIRMIN